jgi:radical SAM-linked protein
VASEAEYLEIGLQAQVDPGELQKALNAALSPGLDIIDAVQARGGNLAERIDASSWRIELPGVDDDAAKQAVRAFLEAPEVLVERMTKQGKRTFDTRSAVVSLAVREPCEVSDGECAILDAVVRLVSPTVRPDDVLSGLREVAALELPESARATRLAQGVLTEAGDFVDPLAADRDGAGEGTNIGASPVEAE